MIAWLRKLFIPDKIEVTIHVPEIHVHVHGKGRGEETGSVRNSSGSSVEEEGSSFRSAPPVTDDERLEELSSKINKTNIPAVSFGQEQTQENK